jgi:hypothetical protein
MKYLRAGSSHVFDLKERVMADWNMAEAEAEFMRAMNEYLLAFIAAHPPVALAKATKRSKPPKPMPKKPAR